MKYWQEVYIQQDFLLDNALGVDLYYAERNEWLSFLLKSLFCIPIGHFDQPVAYNN